MTDTIAASTTTSEGCGDPPPPYSSNDQLLSETHSHDHNGKLYILIIQIYTNIIVYNLVSYICWLDTLC